MGKLLTSEVLKKLKKGFLKTKKKGLEKGADEKKAEEKEEVAKEGEEGPLKGKLVRVVDETSLWCGRVVEVLGHVKGKVHGQVAWKDAHVNIWGETKVPAKVALDEKSSKAIGNDSEARVACLEGSPAER